MSALAERIGNSSRCGSSYDPSVGRLWSSIQAHRPGPSDAERVQFWISVGWIPAHHREGQCYLDIVGRSSMFDLTG